MKANVVMAKKDDIPLLVRHRELMFLEMNKLKKARVDRKAVARMSTAYSAFLRTHLDKDAFGFVVKKDGMIAASGTASIIGIWPPSVSVTKAYKAGYIYGIYTEIRFRKQGLAKLVMKSLVRHLRKSGARIATLYASDAGKHLYESLKFIHKPHWMTLDL